MTNLPILGKLVELVAGARPLSQVAPPDDGKPGTAFYDRRKTAIQAHGPERKWKVVGRSWKSVTGICVHQTAAVLGERPERYDTMGAHIGIPRSGSVVWLHSFNRLVAAANGWSAGTVSVEVDGLFAGLAGGKAWDNPATAVRELAMSPTPAQIVALQEVIRWICAEVEANGGRVRALVAHRQSSGDRPDDPGQEVWRDGVLPMHAELGLSDGGVGFVLGDGKPIPQEWDPRCAGFRF